MSPNGSQELTLRRVGVPTAKFVSRALMSDTWGRKDDPEQGVTHAQYRSKWHWEVSLSASVVICETAFVAGTCSK